MASSSARKVMRGENAGAAGSSAGGGGGIESPSENTAALAQLSLSDTKVRM